METPFGVSNYEIDYPLFLKFFRFHNQRGLRRYVFILAYILIAVGILSGSIYFLTVGFNESMLRLMGILILGLLLLLYLNWVYPRILYKYARNMYEVPLILQLFTDYVQLDAKGAKYSGKSETKYEALDSAFETDDMFFMYLTKRQAYLLAKDTISPEVAMRLRSILQAKLGAKYKCLSRDFSGKNRKRQNI